MGKTCDWNFLQLMFSDVTYSRHGQISRCTKLSDIPSKHQLFDGAFMFLSLKTQSKVLAVLFLYLFSHFVGYVSHAAVPQSETN